MATTKRKVDEYDDDDDDDDLKYLLTSDQDNSNKMKQQTHRVKNATTTPTAMSSRLNSDDPHKKSSSSYDAGGTSFWWWCWSPFECLWHVWRILVSFMAPLLLPLLGTKKKAYHPPSAGIIMIMSRWCSLAVLFAMIGLGLCGLAKLAVFDPRFDPRGQHGHAGGVLKHDHSDVKSVYDLSVGKIDHWCLRGDNDSCRCEDPLAPTSRAEHQSWQVAFKTNRRIVKALEEDKSSTSSRTKGRANHVDVAFIGASIVEEMDGRWLGRKRTSEGLGAMEQLFQTNFNKAKGGGGSRSAVNGVALGIAGDTSPNVLWRLMHGEMSDSFNPNVWWVTLGMNDIGRMQCSEEVVVLGILRVVEEIIKKKPNAHIVINSLFPMTKLRGDMYPYLHDYKDSLGDTRMGRRMGRFDRKEPARAAAEPHVRRLAWQKETHEKILPANARTRNQFKTEEQDAADADAEEALRETLAAHHKLRVFQLRKRAKDQLNTPITFYRNKDDQQLLLEEKHKMIRIRTKHTQQLPLWTSIVLVNEQLKKFAQRNANRVTFFDATPLFTLSSATTDHHQQRNNHNDKPPQYHLRTDLISQRGHPTALGYQIWEAAVLEQLQPILAQYNRDDASEQQLLIDPTMLHDDVDSDSNENNESRSDVDNLAHGIHLDYDAIGNMEDDDFEDEHFHQQQDIMNNFVWDHNSASTNNNNNESEDEEPGVGEHQDYGRRIGNDRLL